MPVTPVIVFGLGGTGMKTLLHLKRMIAEERPAGLPALRVLCIDSDDLIKPKGERGVALDPAGEFLKLEIPGNVGYNDLDRARAWFPRELEYYIPDLATGCKQYKALGRLLFGWNYGKVLRLVEPLRGMVDSGLLKQLGVTQVDDPLVFVVASVCGGTGAGMFLDVGYMLTALFKRKWTRFNTKVAAMLALPSVFSELTQGTERIRSNAYASVKELDHFMNKDVYGDEAQAFRTDYPYNEHAESYPFAPFDRVFVFDNHNGRVSVSAGQVYEMMARYVFLMACGELAQDYNSIDNNLNPKVRGTYRLLNKPTCYSSFGYYSVSFPRRVAVQVAAADLAADLVQQELTAAATPRDMDERADAFLTASKVFFSNQSPQLLHTLSFYTDAHGHKANIQDTIGATIANIDLGGEAASQYEAVVREYDTRFSNTDLALFEADCRREAAALVSGFAGALEAEIQKLADPASGGSVFQVHLFLEELHKELAEDLRAVETLAQQVEKQVPGLRSALETQFLKMRQTAGSRSVFTMIGMKATMERILAESREVLENFWLTRRKAVILRHALGFYKGDPSAEGVARTGAVAAVLGEREAYRTKVQVLEWMREQALEAFRARRSVPDGEFSRVEFSFERDVRPVIEEVKEKGKGGEEARRRLHAPEALGSDLDGLATMRREEAYRRLLEICTALYAPVFDRTSIEDRLLRPAPAGEGAPPADLRTRVKTWLNFSRPFVMLDSVDASRYGFDERHNAARFLAIPHTYAGRPCEHVMNRCPVSSLAECDKYDRCLKREVLEALPDGTSVGHMDGRHELHFLSLSHGFAGSSLINLMADCAPVYRNHMLGHEKIHMLGGVRLHDLREPVPNKRLEALKDHFYLSYACGWVDWDARAEAFRFRTDADLELKLEPSLRLGGDIHSILDAYHAPEATLAAAVRQAFEAMERRIGERVRKDARTLGAEVLAFLKNEAVPLDDDEKRRLYDLGRSLSEGRSL